MAVKPVNLAEKFTLFDDHWSPRVVTELNDYQVKLARIEGEFVWHSHEDTDELFLCLEGQLIIELRDETIELAAGELVVIPRGTEHKPSAHSECKILLLEPRGVVNTGEVSNELTAAQDVWV